ncbi:MAG TPA: short-chain dehydrogenase [Clostridiaceae bacterium]|nr:short-chain dehydrogenase [Clostridiaceae bacterium]
MESLICITGASGGLGKAFAVECASRGWDLFLTDISKDLLSNLAGSLSSTYGVDVIYHTCDLTDCSSRRELFRYMEDKSMKFKGLINIAGLDYEGAFVERTDEQIRKVTRLNIEGNLEMTYGILKLRDRGQPFRIINVASLAAFYPMPLKAMYSASKRFLLNFSIALREELRPIGATVTSLCPAGMPTTAECIRAIDSQGFMGRITTKNVGFVAANTIDHALKGDAVYIPGIINKIIKFVGSLVPPIAVAHIVGIRWNMAHKKRKVLDL